MFGFFQKSNKKRNDSQEQSYKAVEEILASSRFKKEMPRQEFKDKLLNNLIDLNFNKKHMNLEKKQSFLGKFKLFPLASAVVVILVILVVVSFNYLPTKKEERQAPLVVSRSAYPGDVASLFELKAKEEKATGINPKTSFTLTAKVKTSLEEIKSNFKITPQVAFAAEQVGDNLYEITPEKPLDPNSAVTATLAVVFTQDDTAQSYQYSWSYQVEERFQVVSTLPRLQATQVPIDTGVEVTFSHPGFENFEENFSITPQVTGRFEIHGKTAVFVPDNPLAKGSYYEVRIGKGVTLPATSETLAEDVIFGFETTNESGQSFDSSIINFVQTTQETQTNETAGLFIQPVSYYGISEVALAIYQFKDAKEFKTAFDSYLKIPFWAYNARENWRSETSGLKLYQEVTVPINKIENSWQENLILPSPLPEGYYLVEAKDKNKDQLLLQVGELTTYVTVSETSLVVWSHDSSTKKPADEVQAVFSNGENLGATDDDGMLIKDISSSWLDLDNISGSIELTKNDNKLFVPLFGNSQGFGTYYGDRTDRALPYWSYFYLDQPFYRQNDSVNFWGTLAPRSGEQELKEAKIQLLSGYKWDQNRSVVDEQTLTLGKYGTFEGTIKASVAGSLALVVNDIIILEKNIELLSFDKPSFYLDLWPANYGVISGQSLNHEVEAKFFDGTPAAQQEISGYKNTLTTNEAGEATFSNTYLANDGLANVEYITVSPTKSELGEIFANARVRVFPSSQLFKLDSQAEGEKATISGELFALDLESFNQGKFSFYDNPYGPAVPHYPVRAKVTRHWSIKEQRGTYYDFLQKKAVPQYDYLPQEEVALEKALTTDGNGAFTFDFPMMSDSWYTVELTSQDQEGRIVKESTYAARGQDYGFYGNNYFYLQPEGADRNTSSPKQYQLGEKVKVGFFKDNDRLSASGEKNFMYLEAREGIKKVTASKTADYEFTFGKEHVPNIILQGVWFDGRSYWQTEEEFGWFASGLSLSFEEKEKKLDIDVTGDKENYGPGAEAILNIAVKDKDGKEKQAIVNLNLIDEAIYAIQDKEVDFNKELYRDGQAGIYVSYASHRYPIKSSVAEGGGGGGARMNFKDRALFKTVETDKNGKAQIKFTLPDNLTTWRITSHALGEDFYAGSSVSKLVVTKSFMVDAQVSERYLVEDQPFIKVRTFGRDLTGEDPVDLTISSKTLPLEAASINTTGFKTIDITLPALTSGQHELLIEAESNGKKDGILKTFTVFPSYLSVPKIERSSVTAGWKPEVETEEPLKIVFADQHIGQYYEPLVSRLYTYGDRLDQKASREIASELLNQYFGENNQPEDFDLSVYQHQENGGLMLFPYGDVDLLLSAHLAASPLVSKFNQVKLEKYFESVLNDTSQTTLRHSQSLYGLAALKKPVAFEINQVLSSDKITDVDRLYLALAKAVLGDQPGAREIWQPLMDKYSETKEQYTYLTLGETRDDQIENTMLSALIAAKLLDTRAEGLFSWVQDNRVDEIVLALPEVNFIASRLPSLPQEKVDIKYNHLGGEGGAELFQGKTAEIILTPETRKDFQVTEITGQAQAIVFYQASPSAEELNSDPNLSIIRTYEKQEVADGEIIKVTFSPRISGNAPDGVYQIIDFIPSGFRLVSPELSLTRHNVFGDDLHYYPFEHLNQRVSFLVSKGYQGEVSYLIRSVGKGSFVGETPVLQSFKAPSIRAYGEEQVVTVR